MYSRTRATGLFHTLPSIVSHPSASSSSTAVAPTGATPAEEGAANKEPVSPEMRALQELSKIARLLMFTNLVFVVFVVVVLVIGAVSANSLSTSLRSIADSVGPEAVARAASTVQATLDSGFQSAQHMEHVTEHSASVVDVVLDALNNTNELVMKANILGDRLLEHPRVALELGG